MSKKISKKLYDTRDSFESQKKSHYKAALDFEKSGKNKRKMA